MGCIKLSILDEQYRKPEIKVCSRRNELTSDFSDINVRSCLVHGNHLSSTQLITDMYGAVSQAVLYAPFGQIISEYRSDWMLDTIPRFLFNSKPFDEESGLYDYGRRLLDPKWGGFISRDELFEKYFFISPYAYCLNNPVVYIDPDGRKLRLADNYKQGMTNIAMMAATTQGRIVLDKVIDDNRYTHTFSSCFFVGGSGYKFCTQSGTYGRHSISNTLNKSDGGGAINSMLAMAHELYHSYQRSCNPNTSCDYFPENKPEFEPGTVSFANNLIQAYNLGATRSTYSLGMQGDFNQFNNLTERITNFTELGGNANQTSFGFSYTVNEVLYGDKNGKKDLNGGYITTSQKEQYMIVRRDKDNNITYTIYNNKKDYEAAKDW